MRAHFVKACALLSALALARAAVVQDDSGEAADSSSPKNLATANENRKDENTSPVGKVAQSKKGEVGDVVNFLNDGPANNDVKDMLVTLCEEHKCTTLKLGEVEPHLVKSAAAFTPTLKGNTALSENALAPALQMSERALSALESQKSLIDQLEKETQALEALSQSLSKGSSQLNFETQPSANQKGNSFLQAFASSKGNSNNFFDAMLGPSKGSGNLLQMEASLCPMLKIQLATAQSQLADTKNRLDSVTALLTAVNAHKSQLENALKVSESIREALKNQALESAKEAAEEKGKNSLLTVELEKTVSEKKALSEQKAELEGQLATTQSELLAEKQESAALSDALKKRDQGKATVYKRSVCHADRAPLNTEPAESDEQYAAPVAGPTGRQNARSYPGESRAPGDRREAHSHPAGATADPREPSREGTRARRSASGLCQTAATAG